MLKWLIRNRLAAFERAFAYDMSYAREILAADTRAFLKFAKVMGMTSYRKDVPVDVYYAVKLAGTMAEDCGPCTQLMVTMALRDGVAARTLSTIVSGAPETDEVKLGIAFAKASLAHSPQADPLREEIVRRWGPRALVSLAFALAGARIYPTLKYALGHGHACQRVVVAGEAIQVRPAPEATAA